MSTVELWIIPITVLCAILGTLLVVVFARRSLGNAGTNIRRKGRVQQMTCTICHKELFFDPKQLQRLSPPEMALTVRSHPSLVGRRLAEYVCPYCEAAHCFVAEGKEPAWVGANIYEAQEKTANCFECQKPLRRPSWPRGAYDGRPKEAPGILPGHGLQCPHCHAVCCYECCETNTRKRAAEGELLCPRCFRPPMNQFFHA